MLTFHAAPRVEVGPRQISAHERINEIVASLNVVCTGEENGRLYFEKTADAATVDSRSLINEIAHALMNAPADLRERLASINTISLKG